MNRIARLLPVSRPSSRAAGFFMAALGAVLFSGKAIVVKFTYRYGIDAVTLIAFRMLFAMPFFAAVAWHQSRLAARGQIVVMTWKERLQVCLLGLLGYYLSSFLDFLGLRYITASLERLILFPVAVAGRAAVRVLVQASGRAAPVAGHGAVLCGRGAGVCP